MHILYAITSKIPSFSASTIQVFNTCNALSNQGVKVTLFAGHGKDSSNERREAIFNHYNANSNIEIVLFNGDLNRLLRFIGYSISFIILLIKKQFSVVYTRSLVLSFLALLMKKTVVLELHNLPENKFANGLYIRFIANRKIIVVSPSRSLLRYYARYFSLSLSKTKWIPHGGYEAVLSNNPLLSPKENVLTCSYVGSLGEGKGFSIFAALAAKLPHISFVCALSGDSSKLIEIEDDLHENSVNNIVIHKNVSPSGVNAIYAASDILLLPIEKYTVKAGGATRSRQLSPLRTAEYLLTGKPIIASSIWPNKELLMKTGAALFCDPRSVDQWVSSIHYLHQCPPERKNLSVNARQHGKLHTWSNRAVMITALVKRIVS